MHQIPFRKLNLCNHFISFKKCLTPYANTIGQRYIRERKQTRQKPGPEFLKWSGCLGICILLSAQAAYSRLEDLCRVCQIFCLYAHSQEGRKINLSSKTVCRTNSQVILSIPVGYATSKPCGWKRFLGRPC